MTAPQHAADPGAKFNTHADFYSDSAYAAFPQQLRRGGSFGVTMMKVEQEPIDFIDAPVPEIVFCRGDSVMAEVLIDCGDGPVVSDRFASGLTIYPAQSASRTRVNDAHALTQFAFPVAALTDEMLDAGIALDGANFGRWIGRCLATPVTVSRLMDRMWSVMQKPEAKDHLLFDGLTLQFLAELSGASDLAPLGGARPEDERIARVIDYIESYFGDAMTISELAAVACLSPGHFSRTFKMTTGYPVWDYVTRRRCQRAKEMLLSTHLSIAEIAYRCGFANQSHLTRCFKSAFGKTPAAARQETRLS
ncbi:helix-turn-helix domain-containing protein [Litoreibacter roseus]|uniref:HTH araC/xylS-type domain-containing protein n=1 Tax=Litoreibacter roseus TaxID=2601869 RepID=A0A6N6JMX8_9RHOB|nr:AraC family transcriptional regulator [Litoreibacter roseus]GFE66602.1 hypothetical protein KIN_36760 [Litoreibacter roseus]